MMKPSYPHVRHDGADPERAAGRASAAEGAGGHGGDDDVRLRPPRGGEGAGAAGAPGPARSPPVPGAQAAAPRTRGRHPRRAQRALIVLDASAIVELLLGTVRGRAVALRIADPSVGLHVPHLADVEVAQAIRRYEREGELEPGEASSAIAALGDLDVQRHSHEPLLRRVWTLRDTLTAYDAVYVALAEGLDATLVTCDAKLARGMGRSKRIELVT